MLTVRELRAIASARLRDSEALFQAGRYDGSAYLCGYVVELAFKARICKTLKWPGYPQTGAEFQGLASFKVHNLRILLRLSGREELMEARHSADWLQVVDWNPEDRYSRIGTASEAKVRGMLRSAAFLLKMI